MSNDSTLSRDLTRATFTVLCLGALIASALWILRPFLSSFIWAATIVISTWPLMLGIQERLGLSRRLATAVMTIGMLLVLIVPITLSVVAVITNIDRVSEALKALSHVSVPPPPSWVAGIPFQGAALAERWQRLSAEGPGVLIAQITPYTGRFLEWFAGRIGGMSSLILQFLLTVVIAAFLYANGETASRGIRRFMKRLLGANAETVADLAVSTVRGVALGIVVSALVQAAIAGIGLALASIPAAGVLIAVALVSSLAQLGAMPVMLPVIAWKFYRGDSGWAIVLVVFMLADSVVDNVLRPALIRKGSDLPLVLIMAGVLGGMVSFGVMGIFLGPVVLAVTSVLIKEWVDTPFYEEQAEHSGK